MFCGRKVPVKTLFTSTLILALIATLIVWTCDYLVTRRIKDPVKLFQNSSLITDHEFGHPSTEWHDLIKQDVTIMYFYAPWDRQSIRFKDNFELLAQEFYGRIDFLALNCWHPRARCFADAQRTLFYYPSLHAYVKDISIEYVGPLTRDCLHRFLNNLLSPLKLLHENDELAELRLKYDAIFLKKFKFTDQKQYPPGYIDYWRASLKALNSDPFRRIKFVYVISEQLKDYRVKFGNYAQNSTIVYSTDSTSIMPIVKEPDLLKTLLAKLVEYAFWFTPDGNKDNQLSKMITNQSVLLLLTPRKVSSEYIYPQVAMRLVAMHYKACPSSTVQNQGSSSKIASSLLDKAIQILPHSMLGQPIDLNQLNCHCVNCNPNKNTSETLKFMAMDSQLYAAVADQFGVELTKSGVDHLTRAIIITGDDIFVSPYDNSIEGYARFVMNWHADKLSKHYRSSHYQKSSANNSVGLKVVSKNLKEFRVTEISSDQFDKQVLEDFEHHVVVYHYVPFCIMCSSVNHVFLQVAYDLRDNKEFKFVRINSHSNDLPYPYEPKQYPTIVMFPRSKRVLTDDQRESFVYTDNEVNSKQLHSFISYHVTNEDKI